MKKTDPRNILSFFSPFLNLERMARRSPIRLVFPFYHAVNDNPGGHLKHLYPIKSRKSFIRDLDKLLRYYDPVSPEIFISGSLHRQECGFILSFDDGLREVKEIIAPVLLSKGIPAIFFLNNRFIDNKALFFRYKVSLIIDRLKINELSNNEFKEIADITGMKGLKGSNDLIKKLLGVNFQNRLVLDTIASFLGMDFEEFLEQKRPYMESSEIRELQEQGFFIGAHSREHPEFFNLTMESQLEEIIESVSDLRKRFDLNYSFFAFPFTDYGVHSRVFEKLYRVQAGILDAGFGTSGFRIQGDIPHFQRLSMEKYRGDSEKIIKTEYLYFKMKKYAGRS